MVVLDTVPFSKTEEDFNPHMVLWKPINHLVEKKAF